MAEIELEAFNALRKLLVSASEEAVLAAENAAAEVYQKAAQTAAPRESGQLAGSVKVIEGKPVIRSLTGRPINRRFVGPEKKKGYYGYFVEKGHKVAGPRRLKRIATKTTHSQRGVEARRQVPAKRWFEPAVRNVEGQAVKAAQDAFNAKLEELDRR